ncbi:phosphate ABC transporter substrate-binding protein [Methanobacterium formicicum]|uniref:Phosphate binding protein n=1 Tax=Methanobacterium formicicum (strain DSM 3637 / PP1) TaxID=1204725 RepID=K2RC41_METFP|nr:phosphate ABC transporter substrate-binding protein [Methanobacterium formicicum]EKF85839.1 phosphate binding protein [Methanobacterium formicicum DSM 3637]
MKNKQIYLLGIIILACAGITVAYSVIAHSEDSVISIVGSSTVQPVAQALAKEYMVQHPNVKVTVEGGDSNVGIQSVKSGSASIGTVSRNLTETESDGLNQYQIGEDSIAVIVNPTNPVNSLTTDQLRDIYQGKISNWKQVGGEDAPIKVIIREAGSGTRITFEDILFGSTVPQDNFTIGISTYQVMQDVAVTPNAIGYVSQNALNTGVKVMGINGISPTDANIASDRYVLKRPLIFLVKGTGNSAIDDFINFSLSPEGQKIVNQTEYNTNSTKEYSVTGAG